MSTTLMQTPAGFGYAVVQTEYGNYNVDANGLVVVDSRAANSLISAGFTITGLTRPYGVVHITTAGEATANAVVLETGLETISALSVMVLRAGNVVTSDADVTYSGGTVTIADGSTYNTTAGDTIHLIAVGGGIEE